MQQTSHLGLAGPVCSASTGCTKTITFLCSLCKTLLQLCSVWEEVASFLKHTETKEKQAVCSSPLIVVPFLPPSHQLNGNYRRLPICSVEPGPTEVALTLRYPGGKRRELSKLTPLLRSCGEFSSSCCPTGLLLHTPANQLHLISGRPLEWLQALFLTSAT